MTILGSGSKCLSCHFGYLSIITLFFPSISFGSSSWAALLKIFALRQDQQGSQVISECVITSWEMLMNCEMILFYFSVCVYISIMCLFDSVISGIRELNTQTEKLNTYGRDNACWIIYRNVKDGYIICWGQHFFSKNTFEIIIVLSGKYDFTWKYSLLYS